MNNRVSVGSSLAVTFAVVKVDREGADEADRSAVRQVLFGGDECTITLMRQSENPYRSTTGPIPLAQVANPEKKLPESMIAASGNAVVTEFRRYALPLIADTLDGRYDFVWSPAFPRNFSSI